MANLLNRNMFPKDITCSDFHPVKDQKLKSLACDQFPQAD